MPGYKIKQAGLHHPLCSRPMPDGHVLPCAAIFTTAAYSLGELSSPRSRRQNRAPWKQGPAPNGASEVAEAALAQPPDPRS